MSNYVKDILEIAYHRNGISGRGFYAVRFTSDIEGVSEEDSEIWNLPPTKPIPNSKFLAILTDDPGECYVICTDLLDSCGVRFAGGNSWRGDQFEPKLRQAIKEQENTHSGGVRVGPFVFPT